MGEKPTTEEIQTALLASGYLMELEVAAALENAEFVIQTNWPFEDQDEGKSREIDVHAFRLCTGGNGKPAVVAVILCECKNNRNPYVVLTRPKAGVDVRYTPMEFSFPRAEFEKEIAEGTYARVSTFRELGLGSIHYALSERTKGVQFCKITRKGENGRWRADHSGLYDSLFLSLAKATLSLRNTYKTYSSTIGLFFPVVILSGELYSVDCSKPDPTPTPVDRVTFYRELDCETVKGHFMCDFVRESALSSFIANDIEGFIRQAVELIELDMDLAFHK